jgi:hypothetical protein
MPARLAGLLLQSIGSEEGPTGGKILAKTTFVQRLNTKGGSAPSNPSIGCLTTGDVGHQLLVPYSADYFFFRAELNSSSRGRRSLSLCTRRRAILAPFACATEVRQETRLPPLVQVSCLQLTTRKYLGGRLELLERFEKSHEIASVLLRQQREPRVVEVHDPFERRCLDVPLTEATTSSLEALRIQSRVENLEYERRSRSTALSETSFGVGCVVCQRS